jgi:hypothetical protein
LRESELRALLRKQGIHTLIAGKIAPEDVVANLYPDGYSFTEVALQRCILG